MKQLRAFLAVLLTAVSLGAMACSRSQIGSAAGQVAPDDGAQLSVTNENFYDMAIYVITSGVATRLGTVMANRRENFRLDPSFLASSLLSIVARPIGGFGAASTGNVLLRPGDELDFRIATSLNQSTIIIR